jgi:hypothetical protein
MKKQVLLFGSLFITAALLFGVTSCKKSEETVTFSLSALVAQLAGGTIDLNAASSANNVPSNPTIVATFSLNVNAASVTSSNVILLRDWDKKNIPLTVTTSGNKVTIVPNEELGNGAMFKLTFPVVTATTGETLASFFRTFSTIGTFVPAGQIAYWNFEGNANDQVGTFNADSVINITYTTSYKAVAGKAATFDGTTSIIEVPNGDQLTNTADISLCFWMKTNSAGHVDAAGNPKGHFVIGLGAYYGFQFEVQGSYAECKFAATYDCVPPATSPHDLTFNGDGLTKDNTGWKACTFCKPLSPTPAEGMVAMLKDKWVSVVFVFKGTDPNKIATLYLNGEKMKEEEFLLADPALNAALGVMWNGAAPDVYPRLAFGFVKSRQGILWANQPWGGYKIPTSNHFGGQLDDVRIFHRALTATEIGLMFASEKP